MRITFESESHWEYLLERELFWPQKKKTPQTSVDSWYMRKIKFQIWIDMIHDIWAKIKFQIWIDMMCYASRSICENNFYTNRLKILIPKVNLNHFFIFSLNSGAMFVWSYEKVILKKKSF